MSAGRLHTTGHCSWWDAKRCREVGVMCVVGFGARQTIVCPYPGRALKPREEDLVIEQRKERGEPLTHAELRAIEQQVKDEEEAVKLAACLKYANDH